MNIRCNVSSRFLASLFCIVFFLFPLHAHPHMFFSASAEFVWEKADLSGCWLEWEFDQFFSADIIRGYDVDGNGSFDAQEIKAVYKNAFINLKNYYYFTFIREKNQRSNPGSVTRFSVSQKKGKVIYRFFLDLSDFQSGNLALAIYDYTFFCDVSYPVKNAVTCTYDKDFVKPTFNIVENKNFPVYYNPSGSIDDTTIYYEWKKGLQTYYPKEIVVVWK